MADCIAGIDINFCFPCCIAYLRSNYECFSLCFNLDFELLIALKNIFNYPKCLDFLSFYIQLCFIIIKCFACCFFESIVFPIHECILKG